MSSSKSYNLATVFRQLDIVDVCSQAKGAKLVSVACHDPCKLGNMCDMSVHLPLERELCPFDLAPVTSTALQMLFGDTVAIALMQVCLKYGAKAAEPHQRPFPIWYLFKTESCVHA